MGEGQAGGEETGEDSMWEVGAGEGLEEQEGTGVDETMA
jgi:hypothetical protein